MWYPVIRDYYLKGIFNQANLIVFVSAEMITEDEMHQIIAEKEALESNSGEN